MAKESYINTHNHFVDVLSFSKHFELFMEFEISYLFNFVFNFC